MLKKKLIINNKYYYIKFDLFILNNNKKNIA